MDIRVFRYFMTVAREKNITKAAKMLHITQPTLSRQLKQFEEEMGVKLFDRSCHKVVLTEKGELLLERTKELVALCEATQAELLQDKEELHGEIVIGCGEIKGMNFLAEQMAVFQNRFPHVQFKIYSASADDIRMALEKGMINMGLFIQPSDIEKYETYYIKEKDQWGIWTLAESDLAKKDYVTQKDLLGISLILPFNARIREILTEWFGGCADHLNVVASFNLAYTAVAMVKQRMGVAIGMDLGGFDDELCFIPLYPKINTSSVLLWKAEQTFSPAVLQFIRQLRELE